MFQRTSASDLTRIGLNNATAPNFQNSTCKGINLDAGLGYLQENAACLGFCPITCTAAAIMIRQLVRKIKPAETRRYPPIDITIHES
jgi:hypothetical protein